jgi:HK97 family phage prohead protease
MDATKNEIRTLEGFLAVRELEAGQEGESRTIYGRAIVFNSESEVLDDFGMQFREVILPEAATMDFLMTQDIKMNMLHDRKQTVARWNKGKGSLKLSVDREGVSFEFDAPKCDLGDRCLEMVRRGDYSGCSFEFYPDKYDVQERGKDDLLVKHSRFAKIGALTIGLDPAYKQTSVNARELWRETESGKREAEAAEQAKRDAEEKALEEAAQRSRELQLMRMKFNF